MLLAEDLEHYFWWLCTSRLAMSLMSSGIRIIDMGLSEQQEMLRY